MPAVTHSVLLIFSVFKVGFSAETELRISLCTPPICHSQMFVDVILPVFAQHDEDMRLQLMSSLKSEWSRLKDENGANGNRLDDLQVMVAETPCLKAVDGKLVMCVAQKTLNFVVQSHFIKSPSANSVTRTADERCTESHLLLRSHHTLSLFT